MSGDLRNQTHAEDWMAKGSEQFTWLQYELGPADRRCSECCSVLRVQDVARVNFDVASGVLSLRCTGCMRRQIEEGELRTQRVLRSVVEADAA